MAKKRGRPPIKDAASKRDLQISFRVTQTLKDQLEAARRDGISLSQEIEQRLRLSFEIYQEIEQAFGGRSLYELLRIVAEQVIGIEDETGMCWTKDRFAFDQAKDCIVGLLDHFRPDGPAKVPASLLDRPLYLTKREARGMGKTFARHAIAILEMARRRPEGRFAAYAGSAALLVGRLKKFPLAKLEARSGDYAQDLVVGSDRRRTKK